ncbi:uncharacterized protein LOC135839411 [Planococcus citri]|uniref:uncharacterized protein LOC135839411 n=1 Tax=Planococcus citri TaxID=170843 RepID=UPI0031F9D280
MEFFTNHNQHQPISSKMENDISTILSSKKYQRLNDPYNFQPNKPIKSGHKVCSKKLKLFCNLLKSLVNDRPMWEKYEIPECPLYPLRLRYRIVGNVLKAIFYIHERNKRMFLTYFRKEYVKTFTFPASGNEVKIVVLKHIKNRQPNIDDRRPPLQDLSIIPPRSEIRDNVLPTENGGIAEVLRNIPDDVPQQQAVAAVPTAEVPCNFPIRNDEELAMIENLIYLEEQKKRWAAAHRIEVAKDPEPSEANRTRHVLESIATSSELRYEEYNEHQRITAFLRESGLGIEGHEHITTNAELQRILETELCQRFTHPQAVAQRARPATALSQESDDIPRQFVVQADVHEMPAALRTPQPISPAFTTERIIAQEIPPTMDQVQVSVSKRTRTVIQVQTDVVVHQTQAGLRVSQQVPPIVESERTVQETQSTVERPQIFTVPDFEVHRVEDLCTIPEKSSTHIPLVQTDSARPVDGIPHVTMQEDVPIIPISHPGPEERAVERVVAKRTPTQERVIEVERIPARPTIADLLIQGPAAEPQFLPEIMRAMEQPGPIFEMPLLDIPIDQEQKASVPTSPRRTNVVLEDTPKKKPAAKRKKYVFYSNLVVTRKLNKNIKPQEPVSHPERLQNFTELIRRPSYRIVPFDRYETDERNLEIFRHFDVPDSDLRDCGNLLSNLLCQLFEEEDDIMYDEENECEDRIARIRASIRLQPKSLQQSRPSLRTEEPPKKSLPPAGHDKQQFLQVPEIPEVPRLSTQFPTNLPNVEDIAIQVPALQQPIVLSKSPMLQPIIQPLLVETQAVPTEQEKVIELEEVIPQKRARKILDQNIVDVAKIPTESTLLQKEQVPLAPQMDPIAQILAESALQQSEQIPFIPQMEATAGIAVQQGEQIPSIPQIEHTAVIVVPAEAVEQQVEEVVRPRRKRVSSEDVLNRLCTLWEEKSGGPVSFSELCGIGCTDRFTLASTFLVLLNLHGMKMLKLNQEPEDSWSRDSVLIYPI